MGGRKARSDAANIPSEGNVRCQDGSLTLYGTKRQISSTSARFGAARAPRRTQLSRPERPQPLLLNKTIPYSFMNGARSAASDEAGGGKCVCTVTDGECP